MAILTIFSAPKPFTDAHIDLIQRNAVQSWRRLEPEAQVVLIGDEIGMAEVAREYQVRHAPGAARNEQGTPLVSSIFTLAHQCSQSPLLAYVNADILLLPEFLQAAVKAAERLDKFLVIGRRWNLEITRQLDFAPGWEAALKSEVARRGRLHPPAGSDYFIFPRTLFESIPDFAIGRAGWDNWMIYHARQNGWPVIDATPSVMVVHQNHDYSHLPQGKPHYNLEESNQNITLGGGLVSMYNILDSNWEFVGGKVRPARFHLMQALRKIELWLTPEDDQRKGPRWALARRLRRIRRKRYGTYGPARD
ncbi:MAG: hypothetical protein PHS96_12065 [Anaerolineales bacterium]|nr:hypothetical protein [Anaerolineales bacterium]